jgi:hypothetical protein
MSKLYYCSKCHEHHLASHDCHSAQPSKPVGGLAIMTLLGLTACDAKPSDTVRALYGADIVDTAYMDFDGDGYSPADGDCDDDNADVNPGADETPGDGVDSNCDGEDDT